MITHRIYIAMVATAIPQKSWCFGNPAGILHTNEPQLSKMKDANRLVVMLGRIAGHQTNLR
jgi:hypothetical protein